MVVEILVPLGEPEDALTQELLLRVGDEGRMSVIRERPAGILDQAEAFFELTQQQQTAVAGDFAPPPKEASIFRRSKLEKRSWRLVPIGIGWVSLVLFVTTTTIAACCGNLASVLP